MTDLHTLDPLLTAAQCARKLGLTVRALRVYEARGLITPQRTQKNWRLYGAREFARLGEILVLQKMGLTLSAIADLLAGQRTDLEALLALQEETLQSRQVQLEQSLSIVRSLKAKQASGEVLTADDMITLAKETTMNTTAKDEFAWKRYEQTRPRTAVPVTEDTLSAYPGSYRMGDGSYVSITVQKGELHLQLIGQPEVALSAEADDAFFTTVVQAQVTFARDEAGKVTSLTLHQNGHELPAQRVADDAFAVEQARVEKRVKEKTPFPDSEVRIRELIDQHVCGALDFNQLCEPLAELVRAQLPVMQAEIKRLGTPGAVEFKGVDAFGCDVYEVDFTNGRTQWGLSLTPEGMVNGLYMRDAL